MNQNQSGGLADAELQAIQTLYHGFTVRDADLLDDAMAENWQNTPMAPGQQPGRAGMKPVLMAFHAAFSDSHFTLEGIVGFDGRAAVRLALAGVIWVPGWACRQAGRTFAIAMHEFHHLQAGRITHTWHLEDWAAWRQQITPPAEPSWLS